MLMIYTPLKHQKSRRDCLMFFRGIDKDQSNVWPNEVSPVMRRFDILESLFIKILVAVSLLFHH